MARVSQDIAVEVRTGRRLSPTQRGFLASHLRHPDSPALNMALIVRFDERVEPQRFIDAFADIVQSSDALRTQVSSDDSATVTVHPTPPATTTTVDLGRVDEDALVAWATAETRRAFDLGECCYRSVLATTGTTSTWLIVMHHLVTDASSMKLVIEQTVAAYLGKQSQPTSFYGWTDTLHREVDPRQQKQDAYWLDRQPAARPGRLYRSSDRSTADASRKRIDLPGGGAAISNAVAGEYRLLNPDLSWAAFLVTAAGIYLHRLTGMSDFAIGLPVHHRTDETASLIGPTMGVYPVDVHVEPGDTHRSLHKRVARAVMVTLANSSPRLGAAGDYDVVVNVIPSVTPAPDGLSFTTSWIHPQAIDPEHVMRLQATTYDRGQESTGLDIDIDLHEQAADSNQRDRAPEHFATVLDALASMPDAAISDVELVTPAEQDLIVAAESTAASQNAPLALADQLRSALDGNADVVLRSEDQVVTGEELWHWATAIAHDLDTTEPANGRVGVMLHPSIEAVAAIYGCVIANRSFVPLDPVQPKARTAELTRRAGIRRTFSSCDEVATYRTGRISDHRSLEVARDDDSEAYLLFTSGSTGVPKGVPITHRGLAGYLDFAVHSYFPHNGVPIAPLFTALTFDLTITTLFAPILRGGQLVAFSSHGPRALTEFAETTDINWCKATPSHLEILTAILPTDHKLSVAVVGGEAFRSDLAQRLLALNPTMAIFNEYGPTEAVVGCMIHRVDPDTTAGASAVPIGVPAPGVELRVVDVGGQRSPVGVPGELWIAHAGLTAGYLDDADAAESPFVTRDGTRFYVSGDLVERNPDLSLTYLGRVDEQLKVGGIRLDPAEVEQALVQHPAVERAAVRQWTPTFSAADHHCVRCGLASNVPGTSFDDVGVCNTCHDYDRVAPMAQAWFRTEDQLAGDVRTLSSTATGEYDCIHLMSGGKDSTYALYKLVELGLRPYALTFDNGFISERALDNVRRCAQDLGVDYEIASTPQMNAIFRDSLATFSDVCHGCYKTIYTLATNRAVELGVPAIVTGLSRGQLFETRLIPGQFQQDRFDPSAIDRAVLEARKRYHRAPDFVNRVLDTQVFETDAVFDQLQYIDIYRYLDVELSQVLSFLADSTPWQRPADTGRSSNCLINIAGIHAHQVERGYHNYAEPYAWDVRLGHKKRDESLAELDDPTDPDEIADLLARVRYTPQPKQVFTGWVQLAADVHRGPTPTELRSFLGDRLPQHAIPTAFVQVDELPTTANGKLDQRALPAPEREHRAAVGAYLAPQSELESTIIARWESLLGVAPISATDDFFALGGDSLAAVTMIVDLGEELDTVIREELAFANTTPRQLARAIEGITHDDTSAPRTTDGGPAARRDSSLAPDLSAGELTILFDQAARPDAVMYNVARAFDVPATLDPERLHGAVLAAAALHEPLIWTYGSPRRRLSPERAVDFSTTSPVDSADAARRDARAWQQEPFDLADGPLLRCRVVPVANDTTTVIFAMHHVSGDVHQSLDVLWHAVSQAYQGLDMHRPTVGYGDFCTWQRESVGSHQDFWNERAPFPPGPQFGATAAGAADGYLGRNARVSPEQLRFSAGRTGVASAVAAAAASVAPFFSGAVEVNLIASTRDHSTADELFGYLLNPLPIALEVRGRQLSELAAAASVMMGQQLPHRAYPFAEIVNDARRHGLQPPSGRVLVAYNDQVRSQFAGMPVTHDVLFNGYSVADVTFFVEPGDRSVHLGVEYRGSVVPPQMAELLLDRLDESLAALAGNDSVGVDELAAPRPSVLQGSPLDDHQLVTPRILEALTTAPDHVAIDVDGRTLTRQQLGSRSTQVANALKKMGIGPGDRVAVRIDRSVELIVSVLGVVLSGASYVPIDPTYPDERIASMLRLSGARAELARHDQPDGPTTIQVAAESLASEPWRDDFPPVAVPVAADSEAYLIFTSGSTGTPRGVPITHEQLSQSTNARAQFYERPPERFLMVSSVSFDSSIVGLFWSLVTGATLVLPASDAAHDIDALAELFASSNASHVLCVPTLYSAILERSAAVSTWPEHVIVAGEACSAALVERHRLHAPKSQLSNEYGPTEASVWATAHHCDLHSSADVPIGRPIAGTWLCIVDEHDAVVPAGVPGELILGGPNIAAGYLGESSDRFASADGVHGLPDQLTGPVFHTGDKVAIADDSVMFLGRIDDQLNVGGARVEPTDVEGHIEQVPGVEQAVVVGVDIRTTEQLLAAATPYQAAQAMRIATDAADPSMQLRDRLLESVGRPDIRLVAHVSTAATIDEAALRDSVAALPRTHRPSIFRQHQQLPSLPNGKVDRDAARQLPVELQGIATTRVGPTTDSVALVQGLFATALQIEDVAATDSFFDLGGDSLRALEVLRMIEEQHGIRLSTSAIHNAPTAQGLAAELDNAEATGGASPRERDDTIVIAIQPGGTQTPVFVLHNLGVDASMWRPLSGYLGADIPMYGLADPFALLDPFGESYNLAHRPEIHETASQYVAHIERIAPEGPINLMGFCVGGVLGYEVAQQLVARGRQVDDFVVVLDWHAPHLEYQENWITLTKMSYRRSGKSIPAHIYGLLTRRAFLKSLRRRLEGYVLKASQRLSLPLTDRLRTRQYVEEGIHRIHSYVYEPYDGRMTVVRSTDDPRIPVDLGKAGWADLVSELEVEYIAGVGEKMLYEPHTETLSHVVRAAFVRAVDDNG